MGLIWETLAACIGTIAFSVLFSVPPKQYGICGFVSGIGWLVYRLILNCFSEATAAFFAVAVIALLARTLAMLRKVPANVIMIPGIFPIIPGIGIYNMIYHLFEGAVLLGLSDGFSVLKIIGAIVLGLIVIFSLPRRWFRRRTQA